MAGLGGEYIKGPCYFLASGSTLRPFPFVPRGGLWQTYPRAYFPFGAFLCISIYTLSIFSVYIKRHPDLRSVNQMTVWFVWEYFHFVVANATYRWDALGGVNGAFGRTCRNGVGPGAS